jgi:futalosine hydrolase
LARDRMYLVTAATRFEMESFLDQCPQDGISRLVTGVGPVETAVRLMARLQEFSGQCRGVLNFGVGGAYLDSAGRAAAGLLDICLAENEVLGDLGVCLDEGIERISGRDLEVADSFVMDAYLLEKAARGLRARQNSWVRGNFVTVSCASGTAVRGSFLASRHSAICENMEGAAVARVCREFNLPCLEARCISNLVEDRDTSRWKLKQACRRAGEAAAAIVASLVEQGHD